MRVRPAPLVARLVPLVATLALGACTALFFYPDAALVGTPADLGYAYRDVRVETRDGLALHGWLIEPGAIARGSVYFLHGNAENVSTHVRATLWLVDAGYRVFALDYRGYGRSEGYPDLPGVFEDVRAGAAWLLDYLDAGAGGTEPEGGAETGPETGPGTGPGTVGPVHVFGQSLGASLAIRHLERHPEQRARVASLVVEAAFTRYGAVARHTARRRLLTYPFGALAERLLAGPDDPLDAIGALAPLPILLIHSKEDQVVPYAFGEALFAAAGEPKAFLSVTGPHIAAVRDPAVRRAMLDFLEAHAGRASGVGPPPSPAGSHIVPNGTHDTSGSSRG